VKVATELRRGTLVDGRYRIQRLLGQGGFGRTYLVSDQRRFDEFCVLKEFVPNTTANHLIDRARELFQGEAKVLYQLDHPQIPKFVAWFEQNNRLFLVQDYVDGKTYLQILRDRLKRGQTFSEAEVIQLMIDLLPVLDYLHNCYIVHRDISPDNIMLPDRGSKPVLIDLGVVKQIVTEVHTGSLRSTTNSNYSLMVGKLGYCPPEQIDCGQCYPSSDLYALAVSALVLLTGKQPSAEDNLESWFSQEIKIGDRFARILTRMLAENPRARYQSAKHVLGELQKLQEEPKSSLKLVRKPEKLARLTRMQARTRVQEPLSELKQETLSQKIAQLKAKFSFKTLSVGISTSSLLFGVVLLGIMSPHVTALCKPLNNCARDREFQALYTQEIEEGNKAIAEIAGAQSLDDLQTISDRLNIAVIRLSTIPQDARSHSQARKTLEEYQAHLDVLENKLNEENTVERKLASISRLSNDASDRTDAANTLAQYQKAKSEWEKVQQQLKEIPNGALAKEEIRTQLAEAQSKLKSIQSEIEQRLTKAEQQLDRVTQQIEQQSQASAASVSDSDNPSIQSSIDPSLSKRQELFAKNQQPTESLDETTTEVVPPEAEKSLSKKQTAVVDNEMAIAYANDIVRGLAIARSKGQINHNTSVYRNVQTTIVLLRRGKTLEEATRLSNVSTSVIEQLLAWGQTSPNTVAKE
jgi:serine/threonine protein kinase